MSRQTTHGGQTRTRSCHKSPQWTSVPPLCPLWKFLTYCYTEIHREDTELHRESTAPSMVNLVPILRTLQNAFLNSYMISITIWFMCADSPGGGAYLQKRGFAFPQHILLHINKVQHSMFASPAPWANRSGLLSIH